MVPSEALAKEGCSTRRFQAMDGWPAMFYAYIIESVSHPGERYTGHTVDLRERLSDHNDRKCSHTAKFVPWRLRFQAAFESLEQARHFERYLKSGSGHAFANRHIWSQPQDFKA